VDGDEDDNADIIDGRLEVEDDKPSLPSVVENIAEALSLDKACGYFGSKNKQQHQGIVSPTTIWGGPTAGDVPETVDPSDDVLSVGDLTAITLERNEIRKRNRKLLLSRLSIPKGILTGCTDVEIVDAGDNVMMEPNNSMTFDDEDDDDNNGSIVGESERRPRRKLPHGQPRENYFAEYKDGPESMSPLYARKQIDCPQLIKNNNMKIVAMHSDSEENEKAKDATSRTPRTTATEETPPKEITTTQNANTDTVLDGTSDLLLRIEEGVEEEDEDCC
jgi:hypothetical protein